jgi:hypothetical protein
LGLGIALGSLALETAGGAAAALLLWRRHRRAKGAPPPAQHAPSVAPPAPEAADDPPLIEDARAVVATPMTLIWGRLGSPPEHYEVRVDTVSGDALVFSGETRRLTAGAQSAGRQLFHTLDLPQERLLAAHDAADAPIADIRAWLEALPSRVKG